MKVYLFVRWFTRARKSMGWLNVALYLKSCSVCLIRAYGGDYSRHDPVPFPVSLTRTGLPRRLQPLLFIVKWLEEGTEKLVKFYLSMFSLSKLILFKKKSKLTFPNIVSYPKNCDAELMFQIIKSSTDLLLRYCPRIYSLPLKTEFRWLPCWTSSPVKGVRALRPNHGLRLTPRVKEWLGRRN